MICGKRKKRVVVALMLLVVFVSLISPEKIKAKDEPANRFNVVIVLDSSGSMGHTDPEKYRFEAIDQFVTLLAEHGNYLGGVVFSTEVNANQAPIAIDSKDDKKNVTDQLKRVMVEGWTNTGAALMAATESLLANGNPELPSVIILLSDGNTLMSKNGKDSKTIKSLEEKAEAIQIARENDINIYTVCLNADKTADITEMEQISSATGGEFREVSEAEDLSEVFNVFYNLIYGTSTQKLVDEAFPDSGMVEKTFEIPGIGVEEVNVIIYGKTKEMCLYDPTGDESNATVSTLKTMTMIKITDIIPGLWRFVTSGVPQDKIKINMIYNTNLSVGTEIEGNKEVVDTDTSVRVISRLFSGQEVATTSSQYKGYTASLHVMNAYDEEIDVAPMSVVNDHFECNCKLAVGSYRFYTSVSGNNIEKVSNVTELVKVVPVEKLEEVKIAPPNTAPEPVESPVRYKINVWPFKENVLEIDMSGLATDREDDKLSYKVVSSSYLPEKDYTVTGNVIKITHFSLSKGSFDIKAIDSEGLSCNIEVIVKARNIGVLTSVLLGVLVLSVLGVVGFLLYRALNTPFRGEITARSCCNGVYKGNNRRKSSGRMKLSVFGMDPTGLDYTKSYFQATGENFVLLVTDKPVTWNGTKTNKVRVQSGVDVIVKVKEGDNKEIHIRFKSDIDGKVRGSMARGPMGFGKTSPKNTGSARFGNNGMGAQRPGAPRPGSSGFGSGSNKPVFGSGLKRPKQR